MEHLHPMSDTAQRQTIIDFYRAIAQHNIELLRSVVTDDWQYIPAPPGNQTGPDLMIPAFNNLAIAFPDMHIELLDVLIQGHRVAVRASVSGTQSGPLMGVAATSKQVKFAVHSFHEIRDGKIAKTWHMEDWVGVFRQIGEIPTDLSD